MTVILEPKPVVVVLHTKRAYWWHFVMSLVVADCLLKTYLAYRDYARLTGPSPLAAIAPAVDPRGFLDSSAMWKISFTSALNLAVFGLGLFPRAWDYWIGYTGFIPQFANSLLFYAAFMALFLLVNIANWHSYGSFAALLVDLAIRMYDPVYLSCMAKLPKRRQYVVALVWTVVLGPLLMALRQLWARFNSQQLPAQLLAPAAKLCAQVGFGVKNVRFLNSAVTHMLAMLPFPVIVLGPSDAGFTPAEHMAVLAHHLGHWRYWHAYFNLVLETVIVTVMTFIMLYLYDRPGFCKSFDYTTRPGRVVPLIVGIFAAEYVAGVFYFFAQFFTGLLLHSEEFQADSYAKALGYGDLLASALLKRGLKAPQELLFDSLASMFRRHAPCICDRILALRA